MLAAAFTPDSGNSKFSCGHRLRCFALALVLEGVALAADLSPALPDPTAPAGRLAYWNFDAPQFAANDGEAPLRAPALATVPGWNGPAPLFHVTNLPGPLTFRVARATGPPRLALAGGLRFLYRPAWSSHSPQSGPGFGWGKGPGQWARLIEVADTRSDPPRPVLTLSVDPAGTNLVVQARDPNGQWRTSYQGRLNWVRLQPELRRRDEPEPWHEIAFSYTPSNCVLVADGNHLQDWSTGAYLGPGVDLGAPPQDLVLTLGSDSAGTLPAAGVLDEIETFDRPVDPPDLYHFRQAAALAASVALSPPAVTLRWFDLSGAPVAVRRRATGDTDWVMLTNRCLVPTFTDTDPALEAGRLYEYEVGPSSVLVSLGAPLPLRRGRILLLVEQSVARGLAAELDQWQSDLVGDGWTVVRHTVPRHDDNAWTRQAINLEYVENLQRIKRLIRAEYAAAPAETRAVLLLGHVTIPYSGAGSEDGHPDMAGAWPADVWYGDLDGEWSDHVVNTGANLPNPIRRNVPGDGKFDAGTFRAHITTPGGSNGLELAVGRVDLARLPAFRGRTELELLRQYLRKNHRYRFKQLAFPAAVRVGSFFYTPFSPVGRALNENALLLSSRLSGFGALSHGDAFTPGFPCLWAVQGGYGTFDTLHNNRQAAADQGVTPVTTAALAAGLIRPAAAFYLLKGSYFGDWNNYQDDLLRALLALPDSGLAAFWTYDTLWRFEPLGVGGTLGDGLVRTARGGASTRTTFLLGDPTLRALVTAPPGRVTATRQGRAVNLRWEASPEADAGYLVLRSTTGSAGPFDLLTPAPVAGPTFTDSAAPGGRKAYQIRAAQRVVTGSGVFTNLSQAVFVTVN